jgi:glycosyltransferase involved in cell wall biosynthesis
MTISALIPSYNAARTIESAVESILRQTVPPDEIIVLLDGGTDDTLERLERFKDRITVKRQENCGLAISRNRLVEMAKGELIAFLDSDDLWHPKYLEVQQSLMRDYPEALVTFCCHANFSGADYVWREEPDLAPANAEWIDQAEFFKRYNHAAGHFGSPSFACIRKSAIKRIGPEAFQFGGVCDSFLFYQISLLGGVVLCKSELVAYRVSESSMSADRLKMLPDWVKAFEKLEPEFEKSPVKELRKAFPQAYAAKRRQFAKLLLGAGRHAEAREELLRSVVNCHRPVSMGKSLALLAASSLPLWLQPKWPSSARGNVGVGVSPCATDLALNGAKSGSK